MEQFYYDQENPEPLFPLEILQQKAEEYLNAEQEYSQALRAYKESSGTDRPAIASTVRAINMRMQSLRNIYQLIVGGLHGQEMRNQDVLYDPEIHASCEVHGNVEQGDPIRLLNTALCASDGTVLIPAQAIRVY